MKKSALSLVATLGISQVLPDCAPREEIRYIYVHDQAPQAARRRAQRNIALQGDRSTEERHLNRLRAEFRGVLGNGQNMMVYVSDTCGGDFEVNATQVNTRTGERPLSFAEFQATRVARMTPMSDGYTRICFNFAPDHNVVAAYNWGLIDVLNEPFVCRSEHNFVCTDSNAELQQVCVNGFYGHGEREHSDQPVHYCF